MIGTLLLLSALATPPELRWQAEPVTQNSVSDRNAPSQSAAMDADGRIHATWTERAEIGWRVLYALRDNAGAWSTPVEIGSSEALSKPAIVWDNASEQAYVAYSQSGESGERLLLLAGRNNEFDTVFDSGWSVWNASPAVAIYHDRPHLVWVTQADGQPVELRHAFKDEQGWQNLSIAPPDVELHFELGAQPVLAAQDELGLTLSVRLAPSDTSTFQVWAMQWAADQWQAATRISPSNLSANNAVMAWDSQGRLHAAINAQACFDCAYQVFYASRSSAGAWTAARPIRLPQSLGIGGAYAYSLAFDAFDRLHFSAAAMAGNTAIGDLLQGTRTPLGTWRVDWLRRDQYTYNAAFVAGSAADKILAYEGTPSTSEEIVWLQTGAQN